MKTFKCFFILVALLSACSPAAPTTLLPPFQSSKGTASPTQSSSQDSTPLPEQTSALTSTPTQTAWEYCEQILANYQPADGYQTYCDPDYGFALDYPSNWIKHIGSQSPDIASLHSAVRRVMIFEVDDMSNFIRTNTYHIYGGLTLQERVEHSLGYNDRAFPDKNYPSLVLGGHKVYAMMECWQQGYGSAVDLYFQHGQYYTIMEVMALNRIGLDTNWQIARSLQTPGSTPDQNVIPQELFDDSNQLLECNAPTPTPLTPLLPAWTVTPEGASDLDLARHALLSFFASLHDGRYAEAALLYSGPYDTLREQNPDVPADDHAALWQVACTRQSPCLLVSRIVEEKSIAPDEFEFVIEFVWLDGTLFKLGPCCGATEAEMPPIWQFPYTVIKIDGQFKVMEGPVYVP